MYSYDPKPEDISVGNVLRQSLQLIAQFPLYSVYGYHAYRHYHLDKSLIIRNPKPELSTAENILRLLRKDGQYSALEARCWMWPWCFTRSTAAEITRPLRPMWYPPRERTPIQP